ncbi:MAG TPA: TPM domain-containing protein [Gammaproteobacteria bacterium]|nr:TPM domain-containing protein [Gammaproteobacteria bacterium]
MHTFTDQERQQITAAIQAAERRTSGEFVAVVARASDHYLATALFWAVGLVLVLPAPLLLFTHLRFLDIYQLQILAFILLTLLFEFMPGLHMALVPMRVRHARASALAHAQFYDQGVHLTREHSGLLLFVSMAERYVEIVADKGIHERIGAERWQKIVNALVLKVAQGDVCGGFVAAIGACGEAMAEHYPAKPGDEDELSDGLIEI